MNLFNNLSPNKAFENLSPEKFESGLGAPESVVLDVRTSNEYDSGHIPGARNIDIMSPGFANSVSGLDKNKAYYVYCRSGSRSASACRILTDLGFTKVYNLKGGISNYTGKVE